MLYNSESAPGKQIELVTEVLYIFMEAWAGGSALTFRILKIKSHIVHKGF